MIGLSLIPLIAYLPSIYYGDIVDEHIDQRKYRDIKVWFPIDMIRLNSMIHEKLYGAWTFKERWLDRLSIILMHALVVLLVECKFGLIPALLFATAPMSLFVGLWRNGRRYTLANIVAVLMAIIGPWGLLIYPAMRYAQVGGTTAALMYLSTGNPMPSIICVVLAVFNIKALKRRYRGRSRKQPRFLYTFHRAKVVLFFKTLAYFFYRLIVPRPVFMYEDWFQSYGVDKEQTRGFFKKDGWFYAGILCALLCLAGLWYEGTRFATWWFIIFFVPYSNVVTNHQHNHTRYMVLPGIGFYAAVSSVLPWWCFVPVIGANFCYTIMSMRQFIDDASLYNFHFDHSPKSIAPYFIVSQHCVKSGDAKQAENIAQAGLKHSPKHYGLHIVLAHIENGFRKQVIERMELMKHDQIFQRKRYLNDQLNRLKNLK